MVTSMAGIGLVLNVTRNRSLAGSYRTPQREMEYYRYTRPEES